MEFTQEIVVNVPRERFIELFDDPSNLKLWQEGLLSFEPISGTPGSPGATSRLVYRQGKGTLEMIETITRRDLPDAFNATYDAKGVHNIGENTFYEASHQTTRWVAHNVFEFRGAMKLVALMLGGTFRKQSYASMVAFKEFAERS
ncbi:MAG: SRPBCC family protein [Micropruina sp.]|nr:SRPBCC family protein [Micropruina sp.]